MFDVAAKVSVEYEPKFDTASEPVHVEIRMGWQGL